MPRDKIKRKLNEGVALQKSGKLLEAAQAYGAVLELDPDSADAWHLLGTIEIQRHNLQPAFTLISKALGLDPENAIYHHNLAYVQGALGRLEEAVRLYRRAVDLKPDYAEAYFNLSGSLKFAPGDPVFAALDRLLGAEALSDEERCFLHFAAGKAYDDVGEHDRAFGHFRQANRAKNKRFDPAANRATTDALVRVFDRGLFDRLFGAGAPSELPVFVVGMPRSGTSLVEQILASHPGVHGAGELSDIESIAKALPERVPDQAPYPDCMAGLDARPVRGFAEAYLRRVGELAPEAQRIVDKAPLNFRHLGLIALMFPRARIVHCRRDPVDTCLSCYFQNFTKGQAYSFDLGHLGAFYGDYRRLMDHWGQVLPVEILDLDYEALVGDQARQSRRLLEFCGLAWDEACLDFHETSRPVQTASRWQVRQPLYATSVERWRRYEGHLGPLFAALGPYAPVGAGGEGLNARG